MIRRAPLPRSRRAGLWRAALCLALAGCAHYQLGTGGARLAFTTLYVAPVENQSMLPQARAVFSTHLREAFEEDGRVTLVNSPQAADATLSVAISDFHREVAAVREVDTGLASKFTLFLGVTCTLRDNRSGKALFADRVLKVQRDAFTDNGAPASGAVGNQLQSEYNTMPLLAEAVAGKVSHAVLDIW